LSEEDGVVFGVLDIAGEVSDSSVPASSFQVIVEPSEKNLFDGEFQEIFDGFAIFQEAVQFGVVHKIDAREETDLDDLPDETEKKMGLSFDKILGTNVDNIAADGLRGHDAEILVLDNSEVVQVLLVDHTLVNSIRDGIVNQFAKGGFHHGRRKRETCHQS